MRLRVFLTLGVALLLGAFAWAVLVPTATARQATLVVEVPAHAGVLDIARRLRESDVIRSETAFVALTLARGSMRRLKAGEYEIPRDASAWHVLGLLESGRVRQHAVLHPEGATVAELARALEAERLAPGAEVLRVAADRKFLDTLGVEGPSVEGYLFPDTYMFVRGLTVEEMLGRMVQRTRAKLPPDVVERAAARGLSLHQLLTLASIIEREAVEPSERRVISGVFWNRLRMDMPLQADPTVQYAAAKERRALTRADLLTDHPYNTYRRPGLPPGPISSPGLAAIEAAVDPAPVRYLYFVAVDERRHHFSTTVEEHNAAVARYRLTRK
ncbi:MAG TPA: endolytic transglycosylase MltG [Methylomirabilota bacterium]|nr:endolytic transglycosylase MltG [Methylomirabilota bacterium]